MEFYLSLLFGFGFGLFMYYKSYRGDIEAQRKRFDTEKLHYIEIDNENIQFKPRDNEETRRNHKIVGIFSGFLAWMILYLFLTEYL